MEGTRGRGPGHEELAYAEYGCFAAGNGASQQGQVQDAPVSDTLVGAWRAPEERAGLV